MMMIWMDDALAGDFRKTRFVLLIVWTNSK